MNVLTPADVSARAVETLRLDAMLLDLTTVEAIASALRRAAGLLCPCSSRTLVKAVYEPLLGVHEDADLQSVVEDTLEALVAHGDLLELRDATQEDASGALLFAAPPSFVHCHSDVVMMLGVAPDGMSCVPESIEQTIEHVNHVRILRGDSVDLGNQLAELGLIKISYSAWTKGPQSEMAADLIGRMRDMTAGTQACGELPGLVLLDHEKPVRYYRGRWVEPSQQTGHFVGRRPQAYGADLWCYVEVQEGHAVRLVDLPTRHGVGRGCDEAWRLQAAIDYERNAPQVYRVRPGPGGSWLLDFFSPVPMWARRRWEAIGEPVPAFGCLFSFKFSETAVSDEIAFAREYMWLKEIKQ